MYICIDLQFYFVCIEHGDDKSKQDFRDLVQSTCMVCFLHVESVDGCVCCE